MTLSEWSYTATVTAAVLYLVIVEVVRRSLKLIEGRLGRHLQ